MPIAAEDAALDTGDRGPRLPGFLVSFAGMGLSLPGFSVTTEPPDTNGDVGPNHYVQQVNQKMTVFDRTGHVLYGPAALPFSGFPGGQGLCATHGKGDPLVRYDRVADRWVLTQLAVGGSPARPPYFLCVAVSQNGDPRLNYYRYAFGPYTVGSTPALNDYPKLGLWPDGYYATYNMFDVAANMFLGAKFCALDRAQMLAGNAATQICFQLFASQQTGYGGALPSDWDGRFPPPANSPNFFFADDNTPVGTVGGSGPVLQLWRFHADWATPANSTLTNVPANCPNGLQPPCPELIGVNPFKIPCDNGAAGSLNCVPQKGQTQLLDTLGDRLMHRLVYRNFPGDYESIVISRSVDTGTNSPSGIRWYELRSAPGQTMTSALPVVIQQSTYAPTDGLWRWMSSMAQDHVKNMALGFSVSSGTVNPSIYLAGRQSSDPPSTLPQSEAVVIPLGTGSHTNSRWGDYSMMTVDPVDDCTFWYTNEFLKQDGTFNWDTEVVSLKFLSCSITEPSYRFTSLPSTVTAGAPINFTIEKWNADGGMDASYSGTANLTSTDARAILPGSVLFSAGVANVGATLKTEGFRSIWAADQSTPTLIGYGNTTVAARYVVNIGPRPLVAGNTTATTITAINSSGTTDTSYNGSARLFSSDPLAVIPSSPVPFSSGVATVNLVFKTAGDDLLRVTDAVDTDLSHDELIPVVAGAAQRYAIIGPTGSVGTGSSFQLSLSAMDAFGNIATGYSGTATFTSSDGRASLPPDTVFTAGQEQVVVTLNSVGQQSVTAKDVTTPFTSGTITLTVTQTPPPSITVTAPAANANITGTVAVTATGTVDSTTTLDRIDLLVDTAMIFTATDLAASVQWDSRTVGNGSHTVTARIADHAGNSVTSPPVPIIVQNSNPSSSKGCQSATGSLDPLFVLFLLIFAARLSATSSARLQRDPSHHD